MGKKAENTKRKISQAALNCFIEKGVVGTNFSEIAKKAKVNQPLIGYYFKSFDVLFASVIEILLMDLKQRSEEAIKAQSDSPMEALLEYAEIPLQWTIEKPKFAPIWSFFFHMASYHPLFLNMNDQIRKGGMDRISLLLFQVQEEKGWKLKKTWNTGKLAYSIQTQITGSMVMAVTQTKDLKVAKKECRLSVEALVQGCLA